MSTPKITNIRLVKKLFNCLFLFLSSCVYLTITKQRNPYYSSIGGLNQKERNLQYSSNSNYYKLEFIKNNVTGSGDKLMDVPYKALCVLKSCESGCCEGEIDNLICSTVESCTKYKDYNRARTVVPAVIVPCVCVLFFMLMTMIFMKRNQYSPAKSMLLAFLCFFVVTIPYILYYTRKKSTNNQIKKIIQLQKEEEIKEKEESRKKDYEEGLYDRDDILVINKLEAKKISSKFSSSKNIEALNEYKKIINEMDEKDDMEDEFNIKQENPVHLNENKSFMNHSENFGLNENFIYPLKKNSDQEENKLVNDQENNSKNIYNEHEKNVQNGENKERINNSKDNDDFRFEADENQEENDGKIFNNEDNYNNINNDNENIQINEEQSPEANKNDGDNPNAINENEYLNNPFASQQNIQQAENADIEENENSKLTFIRQQAERAMINENIQRIKVLPLLKTQEDAQKRVKIFERFDPNGNGYLSLSEVEKGVREVFALNEKFLKPEVIKHAFKSAKKSGGKKSKLSDDYVEKNEFRTFLVFLRQYSEYYEMFDSIDTSDDKKINFEEFEKAIPILSKWGVDVKDTRTAFDKIDSNDGNQIRFDEFCYWAIEKNLDLENDDNFDDEELAKLGKEISNSEDV